MKENVSITTTIQDYALNKSTGILHFYWQSVRWSIYLLQGTIIYVTQGLIPDEKFARHLNFFSKQNLNLTRSSIDKITSLVQKNIENRQYNPEYKALLWLSTQQILKSQEIYSLTFRLTQESLESLLMLNQASCSFTNHASESKAIIRFHALELVKKVSERVETWRSLSPEIESPYQSPYLLPPNEEYQDVTTKTREKYGKILVGYNFKQLGSRLCQDDLTIAKRIYPLVNRGLVKLNKSSHPFDQLPNLITCNEFISSVKCKKICCIDDSSSMLEMIQHYLKDINAKIYTISESPKALGEIINLKPDLILLDVGMPDLDGHSICKFIRNHSQLKRIPIIMVTGRNTLIDRAKARLNGATDYLTKPFEGKSLQEMVKKYIY